MVLNPNNVHPHATLRRLKTLLSNDLIFNLHLKKQLQLLDSWGFLRLILFSTMILSHSGKWTKILFQGGKYHMQQQKRTNFNKNLLKVQQILNHQLLSCNSHIFTFNVISLLSEAAKSSMAAFMFLRICTSTFYRDLWS